MRHRISVVLPLFVALIALTNFADAAVLNATGILVDGSGKHIFKQCSTCPDEGSSDADTQGGDGVGSATTIGAGDGFKWLASGTLTGPNSLPVLKARAETITALEGLSSTTASAIAQGMQQYHYSGTEDGTFTLTFNLDGLLDGEDESIDAGLSAFSTEIVLGPDGPGHPGLAPLVRIIKTARTTPGSFSDSASTSFTVGAGADFFVKAFLITQSTFLDGLSLAGAADASNTFTASFTAGDVSLLTPTIAAPAADVPEPGTLGTLLTGLVSLGFARRRRPSHNVAYMK